MGIRNLGAVKQLQEPNNVTCHAESKFSEGLGSSISASSHSQAEMSNSQEPLYLQERGRGEVSTFNSATVKQLQEPNNVTYPVASIAGAQVYAPYSDIQGEKRAQSPSTSGRGVGVRGRLDSHQVVTTSETQNDHGEISSGARFRNKFGMTSPSKGMSEAKAEQQSTETLSFRCWCEGCRLMRGRRVKSEWWESLTLFPPYVTFRNFIIFI